MSNRFQFLETRIVGREEIAYVLDTETGKVYRSPVVDFTEKYDDVEELPAPLRRVVRRAPVEEAENDDENEFNSVKVVPTVKRPPIIPPALRGVFLPPDSPGAAVESRIA